MFGAFKGSLGKAVEPFLKPDERLIWVDRFNPTKPRRRLLSRGELIRRSFDYGFFVAFAAALIGLSIYPEIAAELFRDWVNPRIYFVALACIFVVIALIQTRFLVRAFRGGDWVFKDYVLTSRRVLVLARWFKEAEVLGLSDITAVHALDNMLILEGPKEGDTTLFDLHDSVAAREMFVRVMAEMDAASEEK